jgi:hypothetical protein
VEDQLKNLGSLGFSERVAMESDLRILVFATHPDQAHEPFRDQAQALTVPALGQLYLEYNRVHDLDPRDPYLADLCPAYRPGDRTEIEGRALLWF